jgi:hypothetical protein
MGIVAEFKGEIRRGNREYGVGTPSVWSITQGSHNIPYTPVVFEHKTSIAIFIHHAYY